MAMGIYHSTNGVNFTRIKLPTGLQILSVFYSPAQGSVPAYWAAMGGDSVNYGGGAIFTSSNGVNWQSKVTVNSPYTFVSMANNPTGETVALSKQANWWLDSKVATTINGSAWTLTNFNYPANEQYKLNSIVWSSVSSNWIVVGGHWFFDEIQWRYGNLGLQTTTPSNPLSYTQIPMLSNNNLNTGIESNSIVTNNSRLVSVATDGTIFYSSNGLN